MSFRLTILSRAEDDARSIFEWIYERSPDGADRWWNALESTLERVTARPFAWPEAPESCFVLHEVRHFTFRTPRGRTFRGLYTVVDDEVRLLHVRGPGQDLLSAGELDPFDDE